MTWYIGTKYQHNVFLEKNIQASNGILVPAIRLHPTGQTAATCLPMMESIKMVQAKMQHINLSGDATTPLTLSGWSKQVGADANGGNYVLQVQHNYTDNTVGTFANDFSKTAADWQHVVAQVKPAKAFNSRFLT